MEARQDCESPLENDGDDQRHTRAVAWEDIAIRGAAFL